MTTWNQSIAIILTFGTTFINSSVLTAHRKFAFASNNLMSWWCSTDKVASAKAPIHKNTQTGLVELLVTIENTVPVSQYYIILLSSLFIVNNNLKSATFSGFLKQRQLTFTIYIILDFMSGKAVVCYWRSHRCSRATRSSIFIQRHSGARINLSGRNIIRSRLRYWDERTQCPCVAAGWVVPSRVISTDARHSGWDSAGSSFTTRHFTRCSGSIQAVLTVSNGVVHAHGSNVFIAVATPAGITRSTVFAARMLRIRMVVS